MCGDEATDPAPDDDDPASIHVIKRTPTTAHNPPGDVPGSRVPPTGELPAAARIVGGQVIAEWTTAYYIGYRSVTYRSVGM